MGLATIYYPSSFAGGLCSMYVPSDTQTFLADSLNGETLWDFSLQEVHSTRTKSNSTRVRAVWMPLKAAHTPARGQRNSWAESACYSLRQIKKYQHISLYKINKLLSTKPKLSWMSMYVLRLKPTTFSILDTLPLNYISSPSISSMS